jgi:restriction endonuclease S subunit
MELNNQATGATVKGIKGSKLEQMLIDCPPMQLQKDFASKIESIEKQKELIAQSIKETETLFNSRMDYYFG